MNIHWKWIWIGFWLTGCGELQFTAVSSPPIGKTATLDNAQGTIEISENIALAVECSSAESNGRRTGPCDNLEVSTENPEIVKVYKAYMDYLVSVYVDGEYAGDQKASVFVVLGQSAGKSSIHMDSDQGSQRFEVTVLAE